MRELIACDGFSLRRGFSLLEHINQKTLRNCFETVDGIIGVSWLYFPDNGGAVG